MNRFISIIESPGRVFTDYLVIDLEKEVCLCECADRRHADSIAACLNLQWEKSRQDDPAAMIEEFNKNP